MPLPPSQSRQHLHTREITCTGYKREDGLWDIEGHLTDRKTIPYEREWRRDDKIGTPIHDMWLRFTVDNNLLIHDCIAVMDSHPLSTCPEITDSFKKLIGEKIQAGWNQRVRQILGGTLGCTHLVQLIGPLSSTIVQTVFGNDKESMLDKKSGRPFHLNGCHTWSSDSPQTLKYFPEFYTPSQQKKEPDLSS